MSVELVHLCSDPLCMGVATHVMPHPAQPLAVLLCEDHHRRVLDAAAKAELSEEELAQLEIRPIEEWGLVSAKIAARLAKVATATARGRRRRS